MIDSKEKRICRAELWIWYINIFKCKMKAFLFTHWLPEQKMHALDIMEIFSLEISQISSILLRQAFATKQHAFLSTSTPFYCILVRACTEIKLSRYCSFWTRKWPTWTSLGFLFSFCAFPVSPFLIFLLQWLTFYWACFQLKNFYHGVAICGHTEAILLWSQFWSKVMTSEEKQRPTLITASYGWHGSQWVKSVNNFKCK